MKRRPFTNLPAGIRVKWSATNQAYFVMWHDEMLRVLNTREEVEDYLTDLRKERATGGLGARRKSLTFGQMPPFAEFEKAFDEETEEYGYCYPMDLRGIDSVTVEPISLPARKEHRGQPCFGAKTIYEAVKQLAAIWDSNIDAETVHWSEKEADEYQEILDAWERADPDNRYSVEELRDNAGSLASSIMETLGFEWI